MVRVEDKGEWVEVVIEVEKTADFGWEKLKLGEIELRLDKG